FNGTGLDAATGYDFITPSGDIDSGLRVSAFTAQSTSITATLAAAADAVVGPRSIILRARGTGFITAVTVIVATPSGVAPSGSLGTLSPGGTGKISLFRNSSWNITGIKFQRNGVDDDSIVVANFQTTANSMSATVSISGNADLGPRAIALIIDGISVATTISVS